MKKRGFSLLELIVVLIVIGILATLAFTQYGRTIEKVRGAEARSVIGDIRNFAAVWYLEYGNLIGMPAAGVNVGNNTSQIPNVCRSTHYFVYTLTTAATNITTLATRCTTTSKPPIGAINGTLALTTDFISGRDIASGTGDY